MQSSGYKPLRLLPRIHLVDIFTSDRPVFLLPPSESSGSALALLTTVLVCLFSALWLLLFTKFTNCNCDYRLASLFLLLRQKYSFSLCICTCVFKAQREYYPSTPSLTLAAFTQVASLSKLCFCGIYASVILHVCPWCSIASCICLLFNSSPSSRLLRVSPPFLLDTPH